MAGNKARIRELLEDLEYHRVMLRVDIRAVRAAVRKCKEIEAQIKALKSEPAEKITRPADWRPAEFDADEFAQDGLF